MQTKATPKQCANHGRSVPFSVSLEDDGFVAIDEHTVFAVPLHGSGQHLAFGVLAHGGQVFHCFGVIDSGHVLFNDGALVKIGGDVMGRCANQLDTTVMRLVVGFCTLEAGQKAMVNVDSTTTQMTAQVVRENLHVTRQDYKLRAFLFNDLDLLGLGLLLGVGAHWNVMKGNVVAGSQLIKVTVVADDGFDLDGQETTFGAK